MGVSSSKHRKSSSGGLCERNVEKPMVYERVINKESNSNESSCGNLIMSTTTTYEREMMAFAFKKAEWKQERKKLKEEVKMLRALVDEKEEKIKEMKEEKLESEKEKENENENENGVVENGDENEDDSTKKGLFLGQKWGFFGVHDLVLVEQIREERARRDETIEKWKQLYLAIKMELDDLIQRTHEGGLYWKAEEEDITEELKKELKAKEETIKELRSKLASMEQQMFKRDREADILRQSLRIMSSKKVFLPKNNNPPKKFVTK